MISSIACSLPLFSLLGCASWSSSLFSLVPCRSWSSSLFSLLSSRSWSSSVCWLFSVLLFKISSTDELGDIWLLLKSFSIYLYINMQKGDELKRLLLIRNIIHQLFVHVNHWLINFHFYLKEKNWSVILSISFQFKDLQLNWIKLN